MSLPAHTHNTIVHNLTYKSDYQLENRVLKLIHICLNHLIPKYAV